MAKSRWYVGIKDGRYTAFQSSITPTSETHGNLYLAVIGPFQSKRGALWAESHGKGNPHFQTVADAERLSKLEYYYKARGSLPSRNPLSAHAAAIMGNPKYSVPIYGGKRRIINVSKTGRFSEYPYHISKVEGARKLKEKTATRRKVKTRLALQFHSFNTWGTIAFFPDTLAGKAQAIEAGKRKFNNKTFPCDMRVIRVKA